MTSLFSAPPSVITAAPPPPPMVAKRRPALYERDPETGRIYLGSAILNGRIRFLSVSQITQFDPTQEGGCPRRWAFVKLFKKSEGETDEKKGGTEYAKILEHYLKTGEDALPPVLRAGKHFLPAPGPDLEVEQDLALDIVKAVKLRELLIKGGQPPPWPDLMKNEIRRFAGLTANGIPLTGAADFRHLRGWYVNEAGELVREDLGMVVCEIGDHKTTSRINDHVTRGGKRLPGWAKSSAEVPHLVQMVGYGVDAADKHSDLTHVRLSHIYYQTKNGFAAAKRTGLVTVEEIRRRWQRVDSVALEMEQIAASARDPKDVPYNTASCDAYTHIDPVTKEKKKGCPHQSYCDRPARTIAEILKLPRREGAKRMNLFDMQGANGVVVQPQLPNLVPQLPNLVPQLPQVPQTDAQRQSVIEAERARLRAEDGSPLPPNHPIVPGVEGYTVGQNCNGHGYYANSNGQGYVAVEAGHRCAACIAPPVVPTIASVNPADAPPYDPIAAADPLPKAAIETIADQELRAKAEAHAAGHAQRASAEAAQANAGKKEKTSGKCSGGKQTVPLTPEQIRKRKIDCPVCGKRLTFGDKHFSSDFTSVTLPGHMRGGADEVPAAASAPSAPAPAAPPPPSVPAPVATMNTPPAPPAAPVVAALPPPPIVSAPIVPAAPEYPLGPATHSLPSIPSAPVPPLPPAPTVASVLDERASAAASAQGIVLYVDVAFDKGDMPKSLDSWQQDLVTSIEKAHQLLDIRLAPQTHDLGYGKWKGYLAATVRQNVPPPGEYLIRNGTSEIVAVIVEALAPLCQRVIRGSAR